ncbi:hypothetical protein FDC64_11345 [Clostridium botulinum]|uniref:hypothetical protein n=1 Tax=Clostridium botulinum TaxID=1491 RepID=UPI0004D02A55|nr:hypothetical protein [Clostridium botulinum]MBY6773676.1 hypothetical protein [Clostridium botulinum]MBY6864282.1 hypothetical protein [Clostridium botulinum]MBY6984839.1 hypothetical protein [Clostridium botulinum]NEZ80371.1 hypothetical protein [Clostridium botulinum]NFA17683.1 hypothetical protein [Clostridium botulinum]
MKESKLFALINFIIIFLTFFIGFEVVKLKSNTINYILISIINGVLLYLYPKLFDKKTNS